MYFFDLHCDTPYEMYKNGLDFQSENLAVNRQSGKDFENWHQFFAVWIKDDLENPFPFYKSVLKDFKQKIKDKPSNLIPHIAVEGGNVIEKDLSRLEILKNDGIEYLTLTWNGKNRLASGSLASGGLTDLGREAIKELNRLKIATDLSHINDEGFFEALNLSRYPFVSHAGLKGVCSHKRNLSDIQIREIAEKNGIIGICFYPEFLGGTDILEKIYKCIYNILNMGFEDNIALGSDFDGAVMSNELFCVKDVPRLYGYLKERGIEDKILYKIFFGNAEKFFNNLTYGGI